MRDVYSYRQKVISIPETAERIVSFSPSITEILFELGFGDRLVGISAFCVRPAEASGIRKIGSYGSVRYEILDELKPDVIFTISGYQDKFTEELSKRYPVVCFELPLSLFGVIDLVVKVGTVLGAGDVSRLLSTQLMQDLPKFELNSAGTCYLEIDLAAPTSFGAFSYITDTLNRYGLRSIYSGRDKEWLSPDLEYVKSCNPDMIIYEGKMFSHFSDSDLPDLMTKRGWSNLSAVKNGMIFKTPGNLDFFAHHGPSFIREVVPWLSGKVDRLKESRREENIQK